MRAAAAAIALTGWIGTEAAAVERGAAGDGPKRPQALLLVGNASGSGATAKEFLLVGNRVGTVSLVAPAEARVLAEIPAGDDITSLAPLADDGRVARVVAVDHAGHALVRLALSRPPGATPELTVEARDPTCRYPVRTTARGPSLAVSCLWSRRVLVYDRNDLTEPRTETAMAFEPRELLFVDDDTLLAADAFGGGLAVIDAATGEVSRTHEFASHNLRGMALLPGGDRLALIHQQLHSGMRTTSDDIRWGVFITNSVGMLPLGDLLAGDPRLERRTQVLDLGSVATPSGDPSAILVAGSGELVVALGGVSRIALGPPDARRVSHVRVGDGPSALALGRGGVVFVANTRSDSVSVVPLARRAEARRIPLGPEPALTAADRGEALFHDATLSLRGWMSCASCHVDGHTNHRLSDTLGDGNYGAPKRVLSLLGVRDTRPWAWDGKMRRLEDQVAKSVRTTLRGRDLTDAEAGDVAAYLRTLDLPGVDTRDDEPTSGPEAALLAAGREAFGRYACARCHQAPTFTSPGVHNVGLVDELGTERFNAPSLRGVRFRRALLHDGRARSLEDVLRIHPQIGDPVPEDEIAALIAWLKTL